MNFGLNLTGLTYYSSEQPFSDLFKMAGTWISEAPVPGGGWGPGPALRLDPNGYPVALGPGCRAKVLFCPYTYTYWPGATINCTYVGTGSVTFDGAARTVSQSPGLTVGKISGPGEICVKINATDPQNPVRRMSVLAPDANPDGDMFRQAFLTRWNGFPVYRFMDWQCTNNSPLANWSDRPTGNYCFWDTSKGVPLDICLEVARRHTASPWVNVPHLATDDFVREMATLISQHLHPDTKVYVEYSNECWNGQFKQAGYCQQQGLALKLSTNNFEAQLRYYSQRAVQVFDIFTQVLGQNRVCRVMGSFAGNPWVTSTALGWQAAGKGCDALAVAPYFGGQIVNDNPSPTTVAEVLTACQADIQSRFAVMKQHVAFAQQYGIPVIAYEGGPSLIGGNNAALTNLFIEAVHDPGMKDVCLADWQAWEASGGNLYCLFSSMSPDSKFGCWGLMNYEGQPVTQCPRVQAVKAARGLA